MKMRKDDEEEKVWEEEEKRNTKATFKLRLTKRKKTLSFIRNKKIDNFTFVLQIVVMINIIILIVRLRV